MSRKRLVVPLSLDAELRSNVFAGHSSWSCHYCDWYRHLDPAKSFRSMVTIHPVYGRRSMEDIARLDVYFHNCDQFHFARLRLKERGVVAA